MGGYVLTQRQDAGNNLRRLAERRLSWLFLASLLLVLGLVAGVVIASRSGRPDARSVSSTQPPTESLQAGQVTELHEALHNLGASCDAPKAPGTRGAVEHDTDVIVGFAQRHPSAVFPVDDETGRTLSVLLVVRHTLRQCLPVLVPRIDALLPDDLRTVHG